MLHCARLSCQALLRVAITQAHVYLSEGKGDDRSKTVSHSARQPRTLGLHKAPEFKMVILLFASLPALRPALPSLPSYTAQLLGWHKKTWVAQACAREAPPHCPTAAHMVQNRSQHC